MDQSILGEILTTRQVRITDIDEDGWYLFEEINYLDPLDDKEENSQKMTLTQMYSLSSENELTGHLIGSRPTTINGSSVFEHDNDDWAYGEDQEAAVHDELRATFGAQRLNTAQETGNLELLNADFKVRAYFTKKTNPELARLKGENLKEFYVLGNNTNSAKSWDLTEGLATLYSSDGGVDYYGTINLGSSTDDGTGPGYFSFTSQLSPNKQWSDIQSYQYGWNPNSTGDYYLSESEFDKEITLYGRNFTSNAPPKSFSAPPGIYSIKVTMENGVPKSLTVTKGGDYYVAEWTSDETTHFSQQGGEGVYTSIARVDVTDGGAPVVRYVNPLGMVSSQPWNGMNIVVTQGADGTARTQKVLK